MIRTVYNNPDKKLSADIISQSNAKIVEAALRTASLVDVSKVIESDYQLSNDLRSLYKTTRFSIDINTCVLIRLVNGLWWESCVVIRNNRLRDNIKWQKVDKTISNVIDSLFETKQGLNKELAASDLTAGSTELSDILSHGDIIFQRFNTVHGGAVFKPRGKNKYSQYDEDFLVHFTSLISFCVNKELSSNYLSNIYLNIKGIADKIGQGATNEQAIRKMFFNYELGVNTKLGFLRMLKSFTETSHKTAFVVVLKIDQANGAVCLLNEFTHRQFIKESISRMASVEELRKNATLSYTDKNEFSFILVRSQESDVVGILNELINRFNKKLTVDNFNIKFELQAGYITTADENNDSQTLFNKASIACCQAKKSHIQKIIGYHEQIIQSLQLNFAIAKGLPKAILNNELELCYQPIIDLANMTKKPEKFESFIRWKHPEYGIVYDDKIIELANLSQEIIPLGYWVIESVCRELSYINIDDDISISINLSRGQLSDPKLVSTIIEIAKRYNVAHPRIMFELSEQSIMFDINLSKEIISTLKSHHFKVAIDDFGLGQMSFNYLLDVDVLKMSKNFMNNAIKNKKTVIIGASIVKLAKDLSFKVVCLGIDNKQQLEMAERWGTDLVQGDFIGEAKYWSHLFTKLAL